MNKKPAFMFYPGDWLRDTSLRACSIEARGLWIDMLCIMHDGNPRGYLKAGSFAIDLPSLARMAGLSIEAVTRCMDELEHRGVFSRDESGCIYNRRMVRDSDLSELRSKAGHAGAMAKWQHANDLPEQLPAQCANANANANANTSSSKKRGVGRNNSRTTWLTPFEKVWKEAMGGALPYGQAAKVLKPLVEEHGPDKVTAHLQRYLETTEAKFVSLPRFAATFGTHDGTYRLQSNGPRQKSAQDILDEVEQYRREHPE